MDNNPPPPASGANPETVEKAVQALLKWNKSRYSQNPKLRPQEQFVDLILTLKKIPPKGSSSSNPLRIPLPHPLQSPPASSALCLIIDDRPKSAPTSDAARKAAESQGVPVSKVLKLSKLRSEYRDFEKRRNLFASYAVFLVDARVAPLLPTVLGRQFFKKKKVPAVVPVDLRQRNWKEQVEMACRSASLHLGTGTCCVAKVGKVSMAKEEIVENVVAAIDGIAEAVPRKWANVRSFHLKLLESLALPVYEAVPGRRLKTEGAVHNGGQ